MDCTAKDLKTALLLDFYAPVLTEKQAEVMRLYFYEDLSLGEIAEGAGITRQGVRDAIKRGEAVMTEFEEKLHFAELYRDLTDALEHTRAEALEILLYNRMNGVVNDTNDRAKNIVSLAEKYLTE